MLQDEVLGRADAARDAVALTDAATGRSLRYGELADGARRFAAGLRERGARPGDVLGLVASNGVEFPIASTGRWPRGSPSRLPAPC